jgi:predicted phage terminase large subunit-like protein
VGRLLDGDFGMRVRVVRFPALAEEGDSLGREVGEALCPERYDKVALENLRLDSGPHIWSAQYQQRPMAEGGGMFRREHFRYWRRARDLYLLDQPDGKTVAVDPAECFRFATMDPAFTRHQRSDFTVAAVWAVAPTDPPSLLLVDRRRVRVESAEHADMVLSLHRQWDPAWFGIERQNATLTLFVDVQRKGVVVRELRPDRAKAARAEVAVALTEAGRCYFPRNAPWLDEWESELTEFPLGRHDDQVDVFAYAANELARQHVHPRRHRAEKRNTPEERAARQIESRARRPKYHPTLGRTP